MKYLITTLFLFSALICSAQRQVLKFRTITGTVTDKHNHPLTNCTVMFAGTGIGGKTDSAGHIKFTFPNETIMLFVYNHSDNDRQYFVKVGPDQQTLDIKLDKATEDASERNAEDWKQNEAIYTNRILQAVQSEELYEYIHHGQHRRDVDIDGPSIEVSTHEQPVDTGQVYASVEKAPMFGNTYADWNTYVQANLHYPEKAKQDGTQGKVIATFIIERDGRLTDIRILR